MTRDNQSKDNDTGDVKLIFKNTLDDEESGQPKKFTINAKSESAPDVFYSVHIDVDLDQIQDCPRGSLRTRLLRFCCFRR